MSRVHDDRGMRLDTGSAVQQSCWPRLGRLADYLAGWWLGCQGPAGAGQRDNGDHGTDTSEVTDSGH